MLQFTQKLLGGYGILEPPKKFLEEEGAGLPGPPACYAYESVLQGRVTF